MSKVDFTKPVRFVGEDKPAKVLFYDGICRAIVKSPLEDEDIWFATSLGKLIFPDGGIAEYHGIENIPETNVDYSQGVLPCGKKWKALTYCAPESKPKCCFIVVDDVAYFASIDRNTLDKEVVELCGTESGYPYIYHADSIAKTYHQYSYPNSWPGVLEVLDQVNREVLRTKKPLSNGLKDCTVTTSGLAAEVGAR